LHGKGYALYLSKRNITKGKVHLIVGYIY
jgi:hypothetical protein